MARTVRTRGESVYHHIVIRGNNRNNVFQKEIDKESYLEIIKKVKMVEGFKLYAYCIMHNHIHLIINVKGNDLSTIMKRVNVSYAMLYNRRKKQVGHVFQERFKSENIEDDKYLLGALRYIHNNPVKAKMVSRASGYKWSSFNDYINQYREVVDIRDIIELFGAENLADKFEHFHKIEYKNIYLEDSEERKKTQEKIARQIIKNNLFASEGTTTREKQIYTAEILLEKTNLSKRKIAELLGVDRNLVQRIKRSNKTLSLSSVDL